MRVLVLGLAIATCFVGTTTHGMSPKTDYTRSRVEEMSGFPYIEIFLKEHKPLSRAQLIDKAKKDAAEALIHSDDKPIFANILENHLSHLLQWMTKSTYGVLAMAVYDNSGMLMGASYSADMENPEAILSTYLDNPTYNSLQKAFADRTKTQSVVLVTEKVKSPAVFLYMPVIDRSSNKLIGYMLAILRVQNR